MTDSTVTAKQSLKPDHLTMEEWVESRICDVLNEAEVEAFAAAVAARFGGVDMLINNAGQGYVAHFADTPREAWLHEAGVITPVKAFQSLLEASDIASITCVNSLLALQPEEHMIATSAARAALLNMTFRLHC